MRNACRITLLILAAGCVYLGAIYYSRWNRGRAYIERLAEPREAQNRAIVDAHGADRLTVLAFYAAPSVIRRGSTGRLCYGVSNSKSIRIEPPVGDVWPSFNRCIEITPGIDTVYTLTVEDDKGNKKTARTAIHVR